MICMTFNFPLMLTLGSWFWSKQHHKTDLSNISEERILTSLPHWERKYQPILSHRKFAKRLCLFQLTGAQRTQRKKWWWLEVARYGEYSCYQVLSWVSIKVFIKRVFCLIFITRIPRGVALMALSIALGETTKEC